MTIADLIAQHRANMSAKLTQRNKYADELAELRSAETPDDARIAEVRGLQDGLDAELDVLTETVRDLQAEETRQAAVDSLQRELHPTDASTRAAGDPAHREAVRTGAEPRTYAPELSARGERSFFSDAFNAQNGDYSARERIERHSREARVEGEMSERATTTTSFAGLIVPQYLVDQAALVARAGRPFANIVQHAVLPDQGTTFQIPRGTTGASAAVQATENSSVSSTDEVWANLTVNISTVAGQQDVSRQSLERGTPGLDELVYMDLAGAYGVALDQQCLSGTGASGQQTGVFVQAGVNQATAFAAAATPSTFYLKMAGQLSAIESTRFLAPNAIVMHPRRWNWLVGQVDTAGRPLVVPFTNGPFNAIGTFETPIDTPAATPVGMFQGLPVITDASVPVAVGSGPEDQVLVVRREDDILWEEGNGAPKQLRFEQTLGNQLTVKLVVYGYMAFTAGRYPLANGIVGGNSAAGFGLIAPTF